MPRFKKRLDPLQQLRTKDGLIWLLSVLGLGVLGILVVPMFGSTSPWCFGFAYFLGVAMMFAYLMVIVIPVFPPTRPTPFRLRNGTGNRKIKRVRVARKCADGSSDPLVDVDFTEVTPEDPFPYLPPGAEELVMITGDECRPNEMTVSVQVLNEDGTTTTWSSDAFAVQEGSQEAPDCTLEVLFEEDKWYARILCPGMEPPTVTIELSHASQP